MVGMGTASRDQEEDWRPQNLEGLEQSLCSGHENKRLRAYTPPNPTHCHSFVPGHCVPLYSHGTIVFHGETTHSWPHRNFC